MVYADRTAANAFFATRLHTEAWDDATDAEKDAAIQEATDMIERLNFVGDVTDTAQTLQFPRNGDTDIPNDIKIAEYLIAYQLLDGVEPEQEMRNLQTNAQGYSTVRTTYDRSFVQEWLAAGIPSSEAWKYLKPYLRPITGLRINRVS